MDSIRIIGGTPLKGTIQISGAKNAALPLLTACLLTDKTVVLENTPQLADISSMCTLLEQHGVHISQDKNQFSLCAAHIHSTTALMKLFVK